ncbi:hypothetical protein DPMN_123882 [Dreissena polymorpha]|uniref:Uncharacterized protein n=1 Tax=Dreissena polymorpha TaxID=45954 RepID=A0A9D4JRY9_DREPO|nr:hypothetical protein DPMN_123882 [Dreissena polymorpha]
MAEPTYHIKRYKRHVDEAKRAGEIDLSQILRKAEKPIEVNNLMDLDERDLEHDSEGIIEQDADKVVPPDWMSQATSSLPTPSASTPVYAFQQVEKPAEINAISVARVTHRSSGQFRQQPQTCGQ